jgi:hypothetical protein
VSSATTWWIFRTGKGDVTEHGTWFSSLSFWGLQEFRQLSMDTSRGEGLQALEHFHYVTTHSSSNMSRFNLAVTVLIQSVRTRTAFGSAVWHVTNCLTNRITPRGGLLFKSDSFQVSKKNSSILYKPRALYRVQNSLPLAPTLSQISPVYALLSHLFRIHCNMILPSTARSLL